MLNSSDEPKFGRPSKRYSDSFKHFEGETRGRQGQTTHKRRRLIIRSLCHSMTKAYNTGYILFVFGEFLTAASVAEFDWGNQVIFMV
jgi:hypothetical protein